ncbi:MAG: hypothetical protein IJW62_03045, partial [Clostridia bacterium]|nr:hypothetical protein [Clostridia bacterium]
MILSAVASLTVCLAILLPVTGLLLPVAMAEDHIEDTPSTTQRETGLLDSPGHILQETPPAGEDGQSGLPPPEVGENAPDFEKPDPDVTEEPEPGTTEDPDPGTTEDPDPIVPGPPFTDEPPLTESPVLDSITDPVVGITAVNRLVGLKREEVADRKADDAFQRAYYDFAVKLFQDSNASKSGDNHCFSPLSVMLALSMAANGADGQTLAEMEALLGGGLSVDELNATQRTWLTAMMQRK